MAEPNDWNQFVLEDVIAKNPQDISEEEKTFLGGQFDNLTDDERERFGVTEKVDTKTADEIKAEADRKKAIDDLKPETRFEEPKEKKGKKNNEEEEEEDDEDKKLINKQISKQIEPLKNQLDQTTKEKAELQTKIDVDDYVNEHPEFKEFKGKIIEFANHPAYKNIPISFIANGIAGDKLKQIGAAQERQAKAKTDSTRNGGTDRRTEKPKKNVWEMTSEEFQDYKNNIKGYNRS